MKYIVSVETLEWHQHKYLVEADSEEEARDLVESKDGDLISDDFDSFDQFDVTNVEEYED